MFIIKTMKINSLVLFFRFVEINVSKFIDFLVRNASIHKHIKCLLWSHQHFNNKMNTVDTAFGRSPLVRFFVSKKLKFNTLNSITKAGSLVRGYFPV